MKTPNLPHIFTILLTGLGALLLAVLPASISLAQENTNTGTGALSHLTTGKYNTADGYDALNQNTTGASNTAIGAGAMSGNKTGSSDIAIGQNAPVPPIPGEARMSPSG